jgi:hypothetical protein
MEGKENNNNLVNFLHFSAFQQLAVHNMRALKNTINTTLIYE